MRVSLGYRGRKILLHEGETVIGRGLQCGIRFNDPTVSRCHARVFVTPHRPPTLENLSSTNATTVNGEAIARTRELSDRDQIGLGHRILEVELIEEVGRRHVRPITLDSAKIEPGVSPDDESAADELTQPGTIDSRDIDIGISAVPTGVEPRFELFESRDCPRCRIAVSYSKDTCPGCGYSWPPGRPGAVTQRLRLHRSNRKSPRFPIELPVIYSSEGMTFEAVVRDISVGGLFVATELLEPVGTPCDLTALADGHPAITFHGTVVHVSSAPTDAGRPAGLGIEFTDMSRTGAQWLATLLGEKSA